MNILQYNELDTSKVKKQYDKIVEMILRDDFYSADVKKLTGTAYYRAKLDYSNRVLFKIVQYQDKKYALMLEVIHHHAYEKSRFLNGAKIDESKIDGEPIAAHESINDSIGYINHENPHFHILDKIISFDAIQQEICHCNPPVVIIGSAGSGKTMLTLEKMKTCPGEVLYVTGSPYLVENARNLYYANQYSNDNQDIDFLSYRELLETIKVPAGKEMDFKTFSPWVARMMRGKGFQDANKLYEEFKGVLTGNRIDKKYLSREDYLGLGIKQSIYSIEERQGVYHLFEKYLHFLAENKLYDSNLISFEYLSSCETKYDFVVVDEVQDFTLVQLYLILKTLKHPNQFILCGDSNQIVHPNFFSWAKIKSLFYQQPLDAPSNLIRILNKNYRNSLSITTMANKVLRLKNARFGSIDKESHYLVESQSSTSGEMYCLFNNENIRQEINNKTHKSTHFAVLVLRDDQKEEARRYFHTPLIFSIYEAKGLEYDNVILYKFISSDEKKFRDIAQDITLEDLEAELIYSRIKDKSDRSLEIYKFYINAFYVAITRAIKNVYLIENIEQHSLLTVLGLKPTSEFIAIESQESSIDEWQKEMRRLEMQGKQDQADAIRETILQSQNVPWQVMTPDFLIQLREKALRTDKKDKEARLLLFEYALVYHQAVLMDELAKIGFAPALRPKKDYDLLQRKYFMGCVSTHFSMIERQIALYGVDFRNQFNQTALMVASNVGNGALVKHLIAKGANSHLTDNIGRNPFQLALLNAFMDKNFARHKLVSLYDCLLPDHISLHVDEKLTKIDIQRMEFFLINAMIALAHQKKKSSYQGFAFKVDDFLEPLIHFPDRIIPEYRKRRAYISSILAKNEIARQGLYNRKLFMRVKLGQYILNPDIKLKVNDEWIGIYQFLNLAEFKEKYLSEPHGHHAILEQLAIKNNGSLNVSQKG